MFLVNVPASALDTVEMDFGKFVARESFTQEKYP